MTEQRMPTLIDLDDSPLQLRNAGDDIRGRTVFDRRGHEIGDVDGLIIDESERQVRLLRVGSGGVLGIGKTERLIPAEAIARIEDDTVHIDRTREAVASSTPYDPPMVDAYAYYERVYGDYGYAPFWAPGAVPRYP
ncbi:Uncharacterized protein conserved in bacteria [Nocardia otitidiscaviarum]|uniref:Uncharacterized protein conserved in bacteria n=1 Tax=Nocardia otitidiscaviarum TaxID=1823 RepID=A0A378YRL7_9NOCA|nr:PRC-barrel domain-containing protein [Nocardia otitidiscaviarum]SUA79845.1 Uncharacterized protein conserved in bacteria [Nocardia otitidiscaviarum]